MVWLDILMHTKSVKQESRKQNVVLCEKARVNRVTKALTYMTWRGYLLTRQIAPLYMFITRCMSIADVIRNASVFLTMSYISLFRSVTYAENFPHCIV